MPPPSPSTALNWSSIRLFAMDVDGILTDSDGSLNAWFTDSEGNILGLVEGQGDHMT